jgi:hypothetical protein
MLSEAFRDYAEVTRRPLAACMTYVPGLLYWAYTAKACFHMCNPLVSVLGL